MKVHAHFLQKNGGDPTEEWNKIRLGKLTASEFDRFVKADGTLRTGEMPETYLCEKLFQRWTGRDKPGKWLSMDVNNGIIVEEKAALFAEMKYGLEIQHVGFASDDDERYGCSPDGLIGWSGLKTDGPTDYPNGAQGSATGIEIKCPALDTHIKYLLGGKLPADYFAQVQGSMFVTGCSSWHFLSYPLACYLDGFPPFHLIVERDDKFCSNLADSLDSFLERYDAAYKTLCEKNGGPPKRYDPVTAVQDELPKGLQDPDDFRM